eukprot:6621542-Lingulodinium_polyedra.AAC.1
MLRGYTGDYDCDFAVHPPRQLSLVHIAAGPPAMIQLQPERSGFAAPQQEAGDASGKVRVAQHVAAAFSNAEPDLPRAGMPARARAFILAIAAHAAPGAPERAFLEAALAGGLSLGA